MIDKLIKLIIGLGVLLLTFSCSNEKVSYTFLLAEDTGVIIDDQILPKSNFNGINEHGAWSHKFNSLTYSKGTWENGFKKGIWTYDTGQKQFNIDYSNYSDVITNFKISFPFNWKIYEKIDPSSVFSASDTSEIGDKRTKLFVVLVHDKNKVDQKTLSDFNQYYNEVASSDTLISRLGYKISAERREYYLNMYVLKEYGEELLVISLLGESDSIIYDITYKTRNENQEVKLLQFLEMSLTARLNDFRLLDPMEKIESIVKVDFRPNTIANSAE